LASSRGAWSRASLANWYRSEWVCAVPGQTGAFAALVAAAKQLQSGRLDAYLLYMLIALVAIIAAVTALA